MTDLNNVILIGRITHDLGDKDFGYVGNGNARANVSIACNRSRKQGEQWIDEVSYFDVVIWGKLAESLKPNLVKGKQIAVKGYLKQERWESNDGAKKSRVSIVAEEIKLLGGNGNNSGASYGGSNNDNYNEVEEDVYF